MLVRVSVAEPDGALLRPNLTARVFVDAYPDMTLPASFVAASPIRRVGPPLAAESRRSWPLFRLEGSDTSFDAGSVGRGRIGGRRIKAPTRTPQAARSEFAR
jgi:hypothetical protein